MKKYVVLFVLLLSPLLLANDPDNNNGNKFNAKLEKLAEWINTKNNPKKFYAVREYASYCCTLLIKRIQNSLPDLINSFTTTGETVLCKAAYWADLEMINLLLQAGADVNQCDRFGVGPLGYALLSGNNECINMLLNAGAHSILTQAQLDAYQKITEQELSKLSESLGDPDESYPDDGGKQVNSSK